MSTPDHESTRLPVADPPQVRRDLWALLFRDRRGLTVLLALTCLASAIGLAGPYLLGLIVNRLEAGTASVAAVDRLALAVLACAVAQLILTRYSRLSAHRFGERMLRRLREDFVDRSLALPTRVVERAGTGDLTTRASADTNTVGTMLREAMPDLVPALLQVLFLLTAVFWLSPLMGAALLVVVPPVWLVTRWYMRRSRPAYLTEGAAISTSVAGVSATAEGGRTVEALGLAHRRIERTDLDAAHLHHSRLRTLWLRSVFYPITDAAITLPTGLALLVGGLAYLDDRVSLGVVVTCCLYMMQLEDPMSKVTFWVEQVQRGAASFARLRGVAAAGDTDGDDPPEPVDDRIEVRGARFAYVPGREVLHGIDLTVRPGERLAIVGPSGAGKTTLGLLLSGAERPTEGSVLVGGVPIADLGPKQLRERILLVSQEHHVFNGSVRDNLAIADGSADDSTLWKALETIDAEWARSLPDGLDTPLRSSGETDPARVQQLALARVVLADPHTVILDEATSLLDPTSARQAERSLGAALSGRTVIAIAHRLHTAHDADRVAVVEEGRITELGSHKELVHAGGPYSALWRSWHGTT